MKMLYNLKIVRFEMAPGNDHKSHLSLQEAGFIGAGVLSMVLAFILLVVLALNGSCQMQKTKGNGVSGERHVEIGQFEQIQLGGTVDAIIRQCPSTSIYIHGDENLLPLIDFELKQGVLIISNKRDIDPKLGLMIEICTPIINRITLSGAADLTALDLECEILELQLSGVGDMEFTGQADYLEVLLSGVGDLRLVGNTGKLDAVVSGVGDLKAGDLTAKRIDIKVSGVGDAVVYPLHTLDARVSGVGDIIYFGNPSEQRTHISGAGEIIRRPKPGTDR
jgi:hypothetical protein